MRRYSYITIGKILKELHEQGMNISRTTFNNLMKKKGLFMMKRTAGGWYTCTPMEKDLIIELIKSNYAIHPPTPGRPPSSLDAILAEIDAK